MSKAEETKTVVVVRVVQWLQMCISSSAIPLNFHKQTQRYIKGFSNAGTGTINSNRLLEGSKCLCREEEKTVECCYLPWMHYKNYRNCAAVEFPDCYWLMLLSDKGSEDCITQTPHQSLYANSKIQGLAHLPLLNLQSFIVTKLFHF